MLPASQSASTESFKKQSPPSNNSTPYQDGSHREDLLPLPHLRGASEERSEASGSSAGGGSGIGSGEQEKQIPGDDIGGVEKQDRDNALIKTGDVAASPGGGGTPLPKTTKKSQKLKTTPINNVANEVMMHIFSYLDPQSLSTASLVCRKFHTLVTSPHAWRAAFCAYFPQHVGSVDQSYPSGARYFTALSADANYRKEYMLRTQLIRALKRGRPNPADQSPNLTAKRSRHSNSRPGTNANLSVITYNPQIQKSTVTHLDADFTRKCVVAGSQYTGLYSHSDPRTGYVTIEQKRHYAYTALSGLLNVSAAGIGAMDVSASHGCIIGDASTTPGNFHVERTPPFPIQHVIDMNRTHGPDACITAVWIAKRQAVLETTREKVSRNKFVSSVCSASGSSKGIVQFQGSPRLWDVSYNVCPGIPILEIRVDDEYTEARMKEGRIWCVMINALGEVWYLKGDVPRFNSEKKFSTTIPDYPIGINQDLAVKWHCIPSTRVEGCPVGPSIEEGSVSLDNMSKDDMDTWTEQLKQTPDDVAKRFAKTWALDYFLEVDFAEQNIITGRKGAEGTSEHPGKASELIKLSLKGPQSPSYNGSEQWDVTAFKIPGLSRKNPPIITAMAMDQSQNALVGSTELDPKTSFADFFSLSRLFAVGTSLGGIYIYNVRQSYSSLPFGPLREIQTDSPAISSLAMSSLYLVHGGADGLVQAWDPLASSLEPVRTLHSRFSQRARRRLAQVAASNMAVGENQFAAGALFLDPDPTELRGVVALGSHLRTWSFANSNEYAPSGGKRRKRGDATASPGESGKISMRAGAGGSRFALLADIHDATEDIKEKKKEKQKRDKRFRDRFGVGGPEQMTEEEMIAYAQMLSEEAFEQEQRTTTTTTATSTTEGGSSPLEKSWFSTDSEGSGNGGGGGGGGGGEMYEDDPDLARAIRESLETANSPIQHSSSSNWGDDAGVYDQDQMLLYDGTVIKEGKTKTKGKGRARDEPDFDKDLELAIRLSLADQEDQDDKDELYR